jgi:hypothetical protein
VRRMAPEMRPASIRCVAYGKCMSNCRRGASAAMVWLRASTVCLRNEDR